MLQILTAQYTELQRLLLDSLVPPPLAKPALPPPPMKSDTPEAAKSHEQPAGKARSSQRCVETCRCRRYFAARH